MRLLSAFVLVLIGSAVMAEEFSVTVQQRIVEETNRGRIQNGCAPLVVDVGLMRTAQRHAEWMARNRSLTHSGGVSENIAYGYRSTSEFHDAPSAIIGWLRSPGHRRNMLNTGYRYVGVGFARGSDGRLWWVQQFRSGSGPVRNVISNAPVRTKVIPKLFRRFR